MIDALSDRRERLTRLVAEVISGVREFISPDLRLVGVGPVWLNDGDLWFFTMLNGLRAFDLGILDDENGEETVLRLSRGTQRVSSADEAVRYILAAFLIGPGDK